MLSDAVRRVVDLAASATGLLLLSPLLLGVAVLIKLDSPGPVLYRARRIGQGGRPFVLYKLRSMVVGAAQAGPGITVAADRRITRMGGWLRKSKLDELPQLINVLLGDMSLVGPRPEDPRYVALYTPAQREVLRARPGITGAASLRYRDESALLTDGDWEQVYVERIMPDKLSIERAYLAQRSLAGDLRLVLDTILVILHDRRS